MQQVTSKHLAALQLIHIVTPLLTVLVSMQQSSVSLDVPQLPKLLSHECV